MSTVGDALTQLVKRGIAMLDRHQILTKEESKKLFEYFDITPDKVVYGLKTFAAPPFRAGQLDEYVASEGKKLTSSSRGIAQVWQSAATPPEVEAARKRLASGIAEKPDFLRELCALLKVGLHIIGEKPPQQAQAQSQ